VSYACDVLGQAGGAALVTSVTLTAHKIVQGKALRVGVQKLPYDACVALACRPVDGSPLPLCDGGYVRARVTR